MVPKTNINWKRFKNRAIGNQFPPTANKLRENLSAFLRAAENPLNSSERLEVDQSCECMSWEGGEGGEEGGRVQPETNPGREGGKKKRKSHKKNPEKLSICPPVAGDYSGRQEKCRLIVMEWSQRHVPGRDGWMWPRWRRRDGWCCIRCE